MKKRTKILLGVLVTVIILMVGGFLGLNWLIKNEQSKLKPIETQQVLTDVFSIKDDYVNVFLIKDNEEYIAIDAGIHPETIDKELKKLEIEPEQVKTVFLTHSDSDHVEGIEAFKNATIYLPSEEVQMIDGTTARSFGMKNKLKKEYLTIKDEETLSIGHTKIHAIQTPGHTAGSTSYLINDHYLFVGDTMSLKNGQVDTFNSLFNMDTKKEAESIKKIKKITDAKYIFTHHYGYTSDIKEAFSKW